MKNPILVNTGRVIFGSALLVFAYGHFTNGPAMAAYVPEYFPGSIYWVYIVGILLALAGISFIFDRATFVAGILLALMLLVFIATIHIPAFLQNPQSLPNMLKDIIIAASALVIAGLGYDGLVDKGKSEKKEKKSK